MNFDVVLFFNILASEQYSDWFSKILVGRIDYRTRKDKETHKCNQVMYG